MEKTKRLSKSSIAVIVLAVLLALSLVMGLTGAWFTDQRRKDDDDTMTFGKVTLENPGDNEYAIQGWQGTSNELLVPGSKVHVNGGTLEYSGDVDAYVKVKLVTHITINGVEYPDSTVVKSANGVAVSGEQAVLSYYITQGVIAVKADGTSMTQVSGLLYKAEPAVAGHGSVGDEDYVAPVEGKNELVIDGFDVEFKTLLPNQLVLEGAEGDVTINFNADKPVVTITIDYRAAATQFANWEATDAVGTEGQEGYVPARTAAQNAEALLDTILADDSTYAQYEAHVTQP